MTQTSDCFGFEFGRVFSTKMLFWLSNSDSFLSIQIFSHVHSDFVSDQSGRSIPNQSSDGMSAGDQDVSLNLDPTSPVTRPTPNHSAGPLNIFVAVFPVITTLVTWCSSVSFFITRQKRVVRCLLILFICDGFVSACICFP